MRITGVRSDAGVTVTQICGQIPDDLAPVDRLITVNLYVPEKTNRTFAVIDVAAIRVIIELSPKPEIVCGVTVNDCPLGVSISSIESEAKFVPLIVTD